MDPVLHSARPRDRRDHAHTPRRPAPAERRRRSHADRSDRDGAGPEPAGRDTRQAMRPGDPATRFAEDQEPTGGLSPCRTFPCDSCFEAGVHFGHQTRRWTPKMKPFIFSPSATASTSSTLAQTVKHLESSLAFVRETVAHGEYVLFVGTKKQAQEPIAQEATRAGQPFVNKRWLGGMLTNSRRSRSGSRCSSSSRARQQAGDFERMTKKEAAKLTDEMNKLTLTVGGMRKMKRVPGAISSSTRIASGSRSPRRTSSSWPVVATGDTNVDPDEIDHIIPANRRRDPRDPPALRADRRCLHRGPAGAGRPSERAGARGRHDRGARVRRIGIGCPSSRLSPAARPCPSRPDADEDELLPGARPVAPVAETAPAPEASPEEIAAELAREAAEKAEPATAG